MMILMIISIIYPTVKAQLTTRVATDDFIGDQMGKLLWHIPTWVSPTDGTFIPPWTQFRCSQNSGLPQVVNGQAYINVDTYNPTGASFYAFLAIMNRSFSPGKGLIVTTRAKMNALIPKGLVGGIYFYDLTTPGLHDEIDFELLTNNVNKVHTNIYNNEPLGVGHPDSSVLSNPITDWHTYTIEWLPNSVTWKVDGDIIQTSLISPKGPMHFNLNMWVPGPDWPAAYSSTSQYTTDPSANQIYSMLVDYVTVDSLVDVIPPSNDAALKNLTTSIGALSPSFSPSTTNYIVNVENDASNITITPTLRQADAKVTVNGVVVTSGQASSSIPLNVGDNTINVKVTAQNGTSIITYTILVNRAAPILSTDATLKSLTISSGTLNPSFDPTTSIYNVDIKNSVSSLTFVINANQANATIVGYGANGQVTLTSGQTSPSFSVNVGDGQIRFDVTAQDGITTKTYLIITHRDVATGIDENEDEKLNFYPNPAHTNIYFPIQGKIKVSIYSATGKLMSEKIIDGGFLSIAYLLPGQYVVKYEQKDRNIKHTKKLIVL